MSMTMIQEISVPPISTLAPYVPSSSKPWNVQRVMHLYRRLGYSASWVEVKQGLAMTPEALVDKLLDEAAALALPTPPAWADWTWDEYTNTDPDLVFDHRDELLRQWLGEITYNPVRSKMVMFWRNHFVVELEVVDCNNYFWSYFTLLHEQAFGNFQVFTKAMAKNPAMLVYLNGNLNVKGEPNENYARELMELFTMGESNGYTQNDIVQMARALTGWQADHYNCYLPFYSFGLWDSTPKTIFGKTANYTFDAAHDLIFAERASQVAHFIPEKIYKYFVYALPDPAIVEGLGQTFQVNNWELMPVFKQLFKSEHFFEEAIIAAHIKSPIETMVPLFREAGVQQTTLQITDTTFNSIAYLAYQLGQDLYNPPNVAGWKGHHTWINESTMTARWSYSNEITDSIENVELLRENLRTMAIEMTNGSNEPEEITDALISFFTGQTLDEVHRQAAIEYFKDGIPENYFLDGSWNLYWDEAPFQIINCWNYLLRLPEFQLT